MEKFARIIETEDRQTLLFVINETTDRIKGPFLLNVIWKGKNSTEMVNYAYSAEEDAINAMENFDIEKIK
jgi:hypothetical protein